MERNCTRHWLKLSRTHVIPPRELPKSWISHARVARMVQAAQFPLHLQSLLLHSPLQQSNRRVFSPHRFFAAPSPFSRSLPPNWAPAPGAASAGGSSSDDGTFQRGAADPCSSTSRIVNEIRSSSETTTMAFGLNASNNTMNGGAGNVNAGPDLETIQTEVSSNFFFFLL